MRFLLALPTLLSALVLAAHFLRWGNPLGVLAALGFPCFLLVPRRWALRVVQACLGLAAAGWVYWTWELARDVATPVILLSVAAFTLLAAALLQLPHFRHRYSPTSGQPR